LLKGNFLCVEVRLRRTCWTRTAERYEVSRPNRELGSRKFRATARNYS